MWTRRDLLRAVGASATLAALTPGCGAGARPLLADASHDPDRLRAALRAAVDAVAARLTTPFAFATRRRRLRAVVDLDQRGLFVEERAIAIVGGRDRDGAWREHATDDLSPAGVAAAAAAVAGGSGPTTAPAPPVGRTARDHTALVRDPRAIGRRAWLAEADALAERVAVHASSRIVYRASWLVADDDETWIVRADVDHRQRRVRGQVGASVVTWHGRRPVVGEATIAGPGVPTAALLDDAALAGAASDALTLYTPGGAPTGPATVVLAPALVAAILDRLLATPAIAAAVTPAALLTITDDPTAADAFAGHVVDDDGEPARPTVIAADGRPMRAAGVGGARRAGPRWYRRRGPCHLEVVAGPAAAVTAVEATVDAGVVLDGLRDLRLDVDGRLVLRAARARELARGQRTGRIWGDLELRADVGELLAAVSAASLDRVAVTIVDDGPARSARAPALVTRAELGGAVEPARPRRSDR